MVRSTFSRLRTVSENRLSFISTWTSKVSRLSSCPQSCGSWGSMPKSQQHAFNLAGEHVDAPDDGMSSVRPLGLFMRTVVRPQAHFSW